MAVLFQYTSHIDNPNVSSDKKIFEIKRKMLVQRKRKKNSEREKKYQYIETVVPTTTIIFCFMLL